MGRPRKTGTTRVRWARSWCKACKQIVQAEYVVPGPVRAVKCPGCGERLALYAVGDIPMAGVLNGTPLAQ